MKVRFFFLCMLLCCLHCMAQSDTTRADTTAGIRVRHVPHGQLQQWRNSKDFTYLDVARNPSLLERIKLRILLWLADLFGDKKKSRITWAVIIILSVLLVALTVYFLSGMQKAGMFGRKISNAEAARAQEEDIHEINFDREIDDAEDGHNFRLAIRFRYLQLLKQLNDKELIAWRANKTNLEYIKEMNYDKDFIHLTRRFEYTWYGERNVTQEEYETLKNKFQQQMA